ncbi:hypothetical protein PVIIG_01576 [Plasmodium vivax India VII]|uniref:Uncharacterized protein n=3 Tax=Plasmodium vivax TaxID=5855 RepID=A0A0J9T4X8_PLAVI|nr:hypothetical protein PVIIG_01576 [Plasmodium vivax India VII]KMZ84766.1 hypothetical protein PVBG_00546 [Plasmodium vivax Brazil I]KMZ90046.1 hypothetical protein PVMG_03607 [Plasmodium vivax Mauritania I]
MEPVTQKKDVNLPAELFYNKLIKNIEEDDESLNSNHAHISTEKEEIYWLKNLLRKLIRNYKYIGDDYNVLSKEKRCRDVNLWLDSEINTYNEKTNGNQVVRPYWRNYIETVWQQLQYRNKDINCYRQINNFPLKDMHKRKELDDFCENRNYYENNLKNYFSEGKCQEYAQYVADKKESILGNAKSVSNGFYNYADVYNLSDKCSLQNIEETFLQVECRNECMYQKKTYDMFGIGKWFNRIISTFKPSYRSIDIGNESFSPRKMRTSNRRRAKKRWRTIVESEENERVIGTPPNFDSEYDYEYESGEEE